MYSSQNILYLFNITVFKLSTQIKSMHQLLQYNKQTLERIKS